MLYRSGLSWVRYLTENILLTLIDKACTEIALVPITDDGVVCSVEIYINILKKNSQVLNVKSFNERRAQCPADFTVNINNKCEFRIKILAFIFF